MTINDFLNFSSFADFKNQKVMKLENLYEINIYFKKEYNENYKPFYHLNPIYNTIINNNQFKYIVINFSNDSVFICYKIIQIMTTKQIRIIGKPISINNCEDNINIIIKKLKSFSFVKILYIAQNEIEGNYQLLPEYNDYYIDLSKIKFNSYYRSTYGINKILKNKDFEIIVKNGIDSDSVKCLREKWIEGMEQNGSNVTNKSTKDFYKIIEYENKLNINIILCYKNTPISIQNFLINEELNYADCLYTIHLGREKSTDSALFNALSNMVRIQNYLAYITLKEYNINMIYLAGCRPTEKRLLKHKEQISTGVLKYYYI